MIKILIGIIRKMKYDLVSDRIGPDILFTHWKLYYKSQMLNLCKKKFKFFGDTAEIRPGSYVIGCSKIMLGERVVIRPNTMLFGESETLETSILIEDDVMLGCGVHIYVNNHKFDKLDTPIINQGYYPNKMVVLKRGCWIGANAVLLPGVTIGENTVIGAGSIVTKDIPSGVVAVGNPAKVMKKIG